jgi:hypothetical protein
LLINQADRDEEMWDLTDPGLEGKKLEGLVADVKKQILEGEQNIRNQDLTQLLE